LDFASHIARSSPDCAPLDKMKQSNAFPTGDPLTKSIRRAANRHAIFFEAMSWQQMFASKPSRELREQAKLETGRSNRVTKLG
jgi:hypothetical protein